MPAKTHAKFQHTAARRRLADCRAAAGHRCRFNTQPPEGGWLPVFCCMLACNGFNTQPPEGGWRIADDVAGEIYRFNTQPPEGGWSYNSINFFYIQKFQHTAARRRLGPCQRLIQKDCEVSTHSRPKAAVAVKRLLLFHAKFQHTAARRRLANIWPIWSAAARVSTHSRPKAAGLGNHAKPFDFPVSTHSRPKAAGFRLRPRHKA